jgi:hypothetical protein
VLRVYGQRLPTKPKDKSGVREYAAETNFACLNRTSNVSGENGVSTVGTGVNGRDVVPAQGSANGGVKWGLKRGAFRWGIHNISA